MNGLAACGLSAGTYSLLDEGRVHDGESSRSFPQSWLMRSPSGTPASVSDHDLIVRAGTGDEQAIATLFDRYGNVLYAVAYRLLGQRADAEEIVIEAFAQAWRDAAKFEGSRGSVAGWLTTIARSRALDLLRARARRERITASAAADRPDLPPAMGRSGGDPSALYDHTERRRQVQIALDTLPPAQRQAIELAYFEGLSQTEIAQRLQEPLGTIKTRVRLGMEKLRDSLRPYYFERGT